MAKKVEENLSEADLRRYKEKPAARGRGGGYQPRRSREQIQREAGRTQRAAETARERKHAIKEELKRGIDFSKVVGETGKDLIQEEKDVEKVSEKVHWHTDPKGPHGGKGAAPTAPPEEGAGDEGGEGGPEPEGEGGVEEGAKGRRMTLTGTRPGSITEAAKKTEELLPKMQKQMAALSKALGEGEMEELEASGEPEDETEGEGEGDEDEDDDDGEEATA